MLDTGYILDRKYEVVRVLGQGGMGTVYLCRNTRLGNLWAVKETTEDSEGYQDFSREHDMLKRLYHPGIPRIIDIFYEGDKLYMVEDYVQGETLENMVKRVGKMNTGQIWDIMIKLCDIIKYLHSFDPPVIYRDLKPSNIMVAPGDRVVLVDFGISRTYKPGREGDTVFLGSNGYAAPEQYGKAQSGRQTDIYGLGAVMYFMANGCVPTSFIETDEDSWTGNIRGSFGRIIRRAMEFKPEDRYSSVDELEKDILLLSRQGGDTEVLASPNKLSKDHTDSTIVMDNNRIGTIPAPEAGRKPGKTIKRLVIGAVVFAAVMLSAQYLVFGRGSGEKSPGDNTGVKEDAALEGTAVLDTLKGAVSTPTPTPEAEKEPEKDIVIEGVIEMDEAIVLGVEINDLDKLKDKGKSKGKPSLRDKLDQFLVKDILYPVSPEAMTGKYGGKFIIMLESLEMKGSDTTAHCIVKNDTGYDIGILYDTIRIVNDEGKYIRADEAASTNMPSIGEGEIKEINIVFRNFNIDTEYFILKTTITVPNSDYENVEVGLKVNIK